MRKILPILLLFFIPFTAFRASTNMDTNAKIQAIFIYNFTRYIEWPKSYREGNFVVGILGNDAGLYTQLNQMANFKRVANQSLVVEKFNTISDIKKCNIIFVPRQKSALLQSVIRKVQNYSTLIITEKAGLAKQGAAINFIVVNNRQKFELNTSNLKKYDLKVNHALESLAILVH